LPLRWPRLDQAGKIIKVPGVEFSITTFDDWRATDAATPQKDRTLKSFSS